MVEIKMYRIAFPGAIKRINPQQVADALAIAVVISLPWSTSVTASLIGLWLLSALPFLRSSRLQKSLSELRKSLTAPAGAFPVLLWLIAALGMLWADVSWHERLRDMAGFHKLLVIPLLLVQFSRSTRAQYVLAGFLFSCTVLLILSWISVLWPAVARHAYPGVLVKDYIAQSGEFVLCAFGSLHIALNAVKIKRHLTGLVFAGLALAFLINVFYVATSRTQLVVFPCLLVIFGIQRFGLRGAYVALATGAILASLVWFTSPYLRGRVIGVVQAIHHSQAADPPASADHSLISAAQHLSFLKRSIQIIEKAPLIGNGTGSITELFRQSTSGQTGADAIVSANPHNQTFAVAIQLGILGVIVLYAMWISHAMLMFSLPGQWIGSLLVIQNVISSLFNSHLFDFTQGWIYVFGVGVIGGVAMQQRQNANLSVGWGRPSAKASSQSAPKGVTPARTRTIDRENRRDK
jgi:O-antigen ligase